MSLVAAYSSGDDSDAADQPTNLLDLGDKKKKAKKAKKEKKEKKKKKKKESKKRKEPEPAMESVRPRWLSRGGSLACNPRTTTLGASFRRIPSVQEEKARQLSGRPHSRAGTAVKQPS
jgi:hypothetical protein